MKTIIVATDLSEVALNAAYYAADMALAVNADLKLINVYQLPVGFGEIPVTLNVQETEEDINEELLNIKEKILMRCAGKLQVSVTAIVGIFYNELKKYCDVVQPYMVIMGSQGKSASEHFLFGSHATYAMKNLQWPMMTIPPKANYKAILSIGLACDFDHVLQTIPVEEIKMMLTDFKAELHILNTGTQKVFNPEVIFGTGLLQEKFGNIKPIYHFITSDKNDEDIIKFAEDNHIDLLMIFPKQHSLIEKIFKKSHTKYMILHSHIPVLALHA